MKRAAIFRFQIDGISVGCSRWAATMMYDVEGCTVRRWQSATRYYTAEVIQDLFGEWALLCSWGGLGSRRGSYRFFYMPSYQAAIVALQQLDKRRRARGYSIVLG